MYRIIILIFTISLYSLNALAQENIDYETTDAKTYKYSNSGKWDSLIYIGETALKNNIDYFYLRKRIGMAYYYKENYAKASNEFELALKFNSSDISTQEFLYLSYLLSGREGDARVLSKNFNEQGIKDLNIKKSEFIKNLYFESGVTLSNNFTKNENTDFKGLSEIYGEGDLTSKIYYSHLGLKSNLGKRFSFYFGFSYINNEKRKIINESSFIPKDRGVNAIDTTYNAFGHTYYDTTYIDYQKFGIRDTIVNFNYNLKQLEYYINCKIQIAKGLSVTPSFHYINVGYTSLKANYKQTEYNYTNTINLHSQFYYNMNQYIDTVYSSDTSFVTNIDKYEYTENNTSFNNYVIGLSINKDIGKFSTALSASFSNLNYKKQKQVGLSLTYYPKGNLNLYTTGGITGYKDGKLSTKIIYDILIGKKLTQKIWIESFATIGEISNYNEKNAFIVYNNPDKITFRFGLTPIFVFKNFDITLRYQYQAKSTYYTAYTSSGNYIYPELLFNNHLIIGGIKWKF